MFSLIVNERVLFPFEYTVLLHVKYFEATHPCDVMFTTEFVGSTVVVVL